MSKTIPTKHDLDILETMIANRRAEILALGELAKAEQKIAELKERTEQVRVMEDEIATEADRATRQLLSAMARFEQQLRRNADRQSTGDLVVAADTWLTDEAVDRAFNSLR